MLRALNGMVLLEQIKEEAKTQSGIILAEKAVKRRPAKGLVRLVDSGGEAKVKIGETVLYPRGLGTEVILRDTDESDKTFEIIDSRELWLVV